ncbi:hypothetical protein GCM10010275_54060 [Streptomyces litmocidini]|nr:hypothetical protein GCM10010275_54060 [Streptomyces litmocidini]
MVVMTSNLDSPNRIAQHSIPSPYLSTHTFAMRFTSTPRAARLARHLVAVRLDEWGVPYGTEPHESVVLIAGELTANAVRHGHVPGRDFHLLLRVTTPPRPTVRVEVTDTRAERLPPRPGELPAPHGDGGRGLLAEGLAARWD